MREFRRFANYWLRYLKISDQEISRHIIRHWVINYDKELDRIIEKTKATRQALQLKQADKTVLTARAETLRTEFEQMKTRRRELVSVKKKLVLEQILEDLDKHEPDYSTIIYPGKKKI